MKFQAINKSGIELTNPVTELKDQEIAAIRISELRSLSKGADDLYGALCGFRYLPAIILDGQKDLDYYKTKLPILGMVAAACPLMKHLPDTEMTPADRPNPLRWFRDIHDHLLAAWDESEIRGTKPELVSFVNKVSEIMRWSPYELSAKRLSIGHTDEAGELLVQNYAELARHSFAHESGTDIREAGESRKTCDPSASRETVFLWIENNPLRPLKRLAPLLKWFDIRLQLVWRPESLRGLIDQLKNRPPSSKVTEIRDIQAEEIHADNIRKYLKQEAMDESFKPPNPIPGVDLRCVDYALVDLYLAKDLDGREYIRRLMTAAPELPVIALSAIQELREIQDTLHAGADAFVRKRNAVFLPNTLEAVKRRIGKLTDHISEPGLRRNLRGNIRFWTHHRSALWHGDKCYHMIDHGFSHASSVWRLANKLLVKLIEYQRIPQLNAEALYAFAMSVWLHDIGHKGNHRFGEAYTIRHLHGILSAEILCSSPDRYGVFGFGEMPGPYTDARFDPPRTLLGEIRKRILRLADILRYGREETRIPHPFTLEKIALLCLYHNSRNPINKDEYLRLTAKGKIVPPQLFEGADYVNRPIFLEDLITLTEKAEKKPSALFTLLLLLRFIDAIDIGKWRVGEHTEKDLKLDVNQRDCEYLFGRLEQEVMRVSDTLPEKVRPTFASLFFKEVVKSLRMSQRIPDKLRSGQDAFLIKYSLDEAMSVWRQVIDYLGFVVVQEHHFDLHAAFDRVDIKVRPHHRNGIRTTIQWKANRPLKWLKSRYIHEAGDAESRSLLTHILGTEAKSHKDGYVAKELVSGGEQLKSLILGPEDEIHIEIRGSEGKEAEPAVLNYKNFS